MADSVCSRTYAPYTCIVFVHVGNISQLSLDNISSAIVLDSCYQQIVKDTLIWFGQSAVSLPVNCSSLSDTVDVNNGCTVSNAAEVACIRQDISGCIVSSCSKDCIMQFVTPMKVFMLKMNANLAGCIAKTVICSSTFARRFINYAHYCAKKQAVFPVHSVYFRVDDTLARDSCSDIPSPLDAHSHDTSNTEATQNIIFVRQCVVIAMSFPRRIWIDYQWYGHLIC